MLHTDDGPVLANGVFTQAGGTGKESAEKVFYCFTNLQDTLTKLVKFFSQQGSARPSFLPSGFDVTKMLVDNKVRIVTQQDHASAQTKQAEEFNTVRDEYASQLGLPPPLPTIDIHCGDHARANVGEAATKAAHKWLESKIGDQKEPNEYGDNILEQLMRMMDLEIGHRSNPYEFGRGVFLLRSRVARKDQRAIWLAKIKEQAKSEVLRVKQAEEDVLCNAQEGDKKKAKTQKKKSKGKAVRAERKPKSKLAVGMKVWVVDQDYDDDEGEYAVWEATVYQQSVEQRRKVTGSWRLLFEDNTTCNYPDDCIFLTEEDACEDLRTISGVV